MPAVRLAASPVHLDPARFRVQSRRYSTSRCCAVELRPRLIADAPPNHGAQNADKRRRRQHPLLERPHYAAAPRLRSPQPGQSGLTFHGLRHSCKTYTIADGVPETSQSTPRPPCTTNPADLLLVRRVKVVRRCSTGCRTGGRRPSPTRSPHGTGALSAIGKAASQNLESIFTQPGLHRSRDARMCRRAASERHPALRLSARECQVLLDARG